MATKKKTEPVTASLIIPVNVKKLSQGLKTVFTGMSLVFDSIGVDTDLPVMDSAEVFGSDNTKAEKIGDLIGETKSADAPEVKSEQIVAAVMAEKAEDAADPPAETGLSAKSDAEPDASEHTKTETAVSVEEASSTVTLDDVTQVIVQKIKQKRSNNEKIGALLKSYGVSKVGELPAPRYEAFLTDISAI